MIDLCGFQRSSDPVQGKAYTRSGEGAHPVLLQVMTVLRHHGSSPPSLIPPELLSWEAAPIPYREICRR